MMGCRTVGSCLYDRGVCNAETPVGHADVSNGKQLRVTAAQGNALSQSERHWER